MLLLPPRTHVLLECSAFKCTGMCNNSSQRCRKLTAVTARPLYQGHFHTKVLCLQACSMASWCCHLPAQPTALPLAAQAYAGTMQPLSPPPPAPPPPVLLCKLPLHNTPCLSCRQPTAVMIDPICKPLCVLAGLRHGTRAFVAATCHSPAGSTVSGCTGAQRDCCNIASLSRPIPPLRVSAAVQASTPMPLT